MNLADCLQSLCGYGIGFLNRGGRLVIRSATHTLTDAQKATLTAHKPLLLSILPDGVWQTAGACLNALEAYTERTAIMAESGVAIVDIEPVAVAQARRVLLSVPV